MPSNFLTVKFTAFLDRSKVFAALDRKRRRVLLRVGGFTRTAMRQSMRKARRAKPGDSGGSKPYEPPRYRQKGLRDGIFFAFDETTQSIVTGPILHKNAAGLSRTPETLNEGGRVRMTLPSGERVTATYLPRPYATEGSPAFQRGLEFYERLLAEVPLE